MMRRAPSVASRRVAPAARRLPGVAVARGAAPRLAQQRRTLLQILSIAFEADFPWTVWAAIMMNSSLTGAFLVFYKDKIPARFQLNRKRVWFIIWWPQLYRYTEFIYGILAGALTAFLLGVASILMGGSGQFMNWSWASQAGPALGSSFAANRHSGPALGRSFDDSENKKEGEVRHFLFYNANLDLLLCLGAVWGALGSMLGTGLGSAFLIEQKYGTMTLPSEGVDRSFAARLRALWRLAAIKRPPPRL